MSGTESGGLGDLGKANSSSSSTTHVTTPAGNANQTTTKTPRTYLQKGASFNPGAQRYEATISYTPKDKSAPNSLKIYVGKYDHEINAARASIYCQLKAVQLGLKDSTCELNVVLLKDLLPRNSDGLKFRAKDKDKVIITSPEVASQVLERFAQALENSDDVIFKAEKEIFDWEIKKFIRKVDPTEATTNPMLSTQQQHPGRKRESENTSPAGIDGLTTLWHAAQAVERSLSSTKRARIDNSSSSSTDQAPTTTSNKPGTR